MEVTAVSVGKAVLDGALGYAKSKAAEEIALQLGIEHDVDFITDELQMMQSFLMTADEERNQNKVLTTWVQQIRDLAYKVEDSLMDYGLYTEKKPLWGCIPRSPCDRRRIAMEVKELRAKVEDVSKRNVRYNLIKESPGIKLAAAAEQASIASEAIFGISEARLAAQEKEKSMVNLHQLITSDDVDRRVITVWGRTGDLGKTTAIQEVYDDPKVFENFGVRAWVRLMHPFSPKEFIQCLVRQFYENLPEKLGDTWQRKTRGVNVLMKMQSMSESEMFDVFDTQVSDNSYLIVIDGLSTIVEWSCINNFFPDNKKRSRIIVSTQQVEIASLCTEKPYHVSELWQLSADQTLYMFHKKAMHGSCSDVPISHSNKVTPTEKNAAMRRSEIQEEDQESKNSSGDKVYESTARKKFEHSNTLVLLDQVLTGRDTDKSFLIKLIGQPDNNQGCKVISVWGMGGLGKTTLVRSVYRSQELGGWKRAWATAFRPFNLEVLLRDLAVQLQKSVTDDPTEATATEAQKKSISMMKLRELKDELARLLVKTRNCIIVLDDISSNIEWDSVKGCLDNAGTVIITTREKNIAAYCSRESNNMFNLEGLRDDAALALFIKKVYKDTTGENDLAPAMLEQARLILKKCDGLPLAISTIGGFLATKQKTATEWKKMNNGISAELEINLELRTIRTILMRSYDGLPYHLKSVFLYMAIFPEDFKIRRNRLLKRWIAEGYSRDIHGMIAEEVAGKYFAELLDRSMILPGESANDFNEKISSCQLHDIIREICISKAREENLVFTLEEGFCLSKAKGEIRHLVIGSNWKRNSDVLEIMLDLSHVRSLTVFGEWKPFFISDKMRFVRVLDLEDTSELQDDHLDQIGQLVHLKYLSLRECCSISCLPNSWGNLRHLETLDVRGTDIFELPTTLTKLPKLQHLHVVDIKGEENNWRHGVEAPSGIGKMKALHTLGGVRCKGKATLKELLQLAQLRKLRVSGVCRTNNKGLWSAIAGHDKLQKLSVQANHPWDELDGCLGKGLSPPSCLVNLKLYGKLVRVTDWIYLLQNLCKLTLRFTGLEEDDIIQGLGKLPNLVVLRLKVQSFTGKHLHFQGLSFPNLMVLELHRLYKLESVLFEEDAMPRLELLQADSCIPLKEISGLPSLTSLREIWLGSHGGFPNKLKTEVQSQLQEHAKLVRLNMS
uniref:Uncharacterized protein n=1 Tax=Avena sativa TaxID=4498 RepID=A0ACD5UKB3_AVESA